MYSSGKSELDPFYRIRLLLEEDDNVAAFPHILLGGILLLKELRTWIGKMFQGLKSSCCQTSRPELKVRVEEQN